MSAFIPQADPRKKSLWQVVLFSSILLLMLCLSSPAHAHRVNVFAYAQNNTITAEATIGKNKPILDSTVIVTNGTNGNILLQGRTDPQGHFSFKKPELAPTDSLVITINAGQGHQGSWTLSPEDLGSRTPIDSTTIEDDRNAPEQPLQAALTPDQQQQLARMIRDAVAREVEPLHQMLARQMNNDPSLQDIIGGIGWLVGIGGLLFALKKKTP